MIGLFRLKIIRYHSFNRWLLISFFCLAEGFLLQAQQQFLKFDHLTINDGLSSNRIWCIYRDSKNYLWMGSDLEGLDKYDSYKVTKYRYNEKHAGTISNNDIRCLLEDREKNLWIGTLDGLNIYDPATESFKVFKNNPGDTNSLSNNNIYSIFESKNGTLWITTSGGLNKWVPDKNNFIRYRTSSIKDEEIANSTTSIKEDSNGNLWVVTIDRGIYRFNPETGEFFFYEDPTDFSGHHAKYLWIDKQDNIWIGVNGNGLYSFDPVTGKFKHFNVNGDGKGTNGNLIRDIIDENDRYLLIAVDAGGINRFDKISKTFEYIMFNDRNDGGLNNNGIWCFHKDREGILWVGTSGGGINYINPKNKKFKLFRHNSNDPKSLSYSFTGCFFEDHQGLIWIGTDGGGVNVFDPETGNFKVFKHNPSDPYSLSGNVIRTIAEDKDHDMWIGTWATGLNRYDRKTGRFFHYMPETNNLSSISDQTVWNLIVDQNNIVWLGISLGGVDLLDKKKGVIRRFRNNPDDPKSISSNSITLFLEDSEKNMWICTQNGLNLYNNRDSSFKVYNFPDNQIQAFCRDKDGNLWVGSGSKGVYYCKPDGTIITTYDISNGLPNNRIQAIIEDNSGNIWISTNIGISQFNRKTQKFRNYSKEDNLQGDQFFYQSFLKTRNGELYFGGMNGFNSFYPDSLKDNDFIPPVYITDLLIFNKPVIYGVPGAQFQTHISEAKEIILNWHQSVFSFSFAAVNYTSSDKNQYAYIMEGFEKEWNYTDASRRYVTYTNLNPGKYTFHVKASNNDGIWNEKGVSLQVVILPPWWNTLWFRLIFIFTLISILTSIYFLRVKNLKNQKIKLEKLVAIKTTELSELNASKDKFFSIIAHDLKNPFNSIIGLSELQKEEIKSGDLEGIVEYTEMINISAVQTLRLLENLLEWANSQTGRILFNPVPINLRELFNEEFSMLNEMATGKNIELICCFPDNLKIVADRNMIKTILRNLISNAIKFTHKNGKVEVKAMIENNRVEISVSDSGIGMTEETMAKLFRIDANLTTRGTENEKGTGLGLLLCKEFVEKHDGKIWVESESGKGSIFKFSLPLEINHSV